jgi:phosphate uptake regulator
MGTLAIMGFAAEDNLRSVAQALGRGESSALSRVAERNAKQPRLRAEIEEQIAEELARMPTGTRSSRKLLLASRVALLFETMGAQTVEIAQLCGQLLRDSRPGRLTDIRKLVEHAVYITDRAASGLVEEDLAMAKIARGQRVAANELHSRIVRELALLASGSAEARPRVDLLGQIASKAHGLIEEAGRLADDVTLWLQSAAA